MANFDVHVYMHDHSNEQHGVLMAELQKIGQKLIDMENHIMAAMDDLATAVAAEDTVIGSAVVLLQGLKAALDAAGTDPTKLAALSADITSQTKALSDAVAANTPVVVTPPPPPPPPPPPVPPVV